MRHKTLLLAIPLLIAAGCGGGGGDAATTGTGGDSSVSMGALSAVYSRAASNLKPAVSSQGKGALITGIAGANFSKIIAAPPASLTQTWIAFSSKGAIYLVHPDGSNLHEISPVSGVQGPLNPCWYPTGAFVYSLDRIAGTNTAMQVFRRNENGTSPLQLTNTTGTIFAPSASASKIAYFSNDTGKYQIFTMNSDGSLPTQISDGSTNAEYPLFSSDGQTIYYEQLDGSAYNMYKMSVTGASPTKLFSLGSTAVTDAISNDGTMFAYQTSNNISIMPPNGVPVQVTTAPTGQGDSSPSFSPDGKMLVFTRRTTTTGVLMVQNIDGSNQQALTGADFNATSAAWSPAVGARLFVGSGGNMGANASGFLVGQLNTAITSFVSFTCTTPSTATVTVQSPGGEPSNAAFQISGDALTGIKYTNDLYGPVTAVLPGVGGTTAAGAIVSFDSTTGLVSLILPYVSAKRVETKDGTLAYQGRFLGGYDATGKEVLASGARSVRINLHTGKLVG